MAATVAVVVVSGLVVPTDAEPAAAAPSATNLDLGRSVPVRELVTEPEPAAVAPVAAPRRVVWPVPASVEIDLPAAGAGAGASARVVVGGLPVTVSGVAAPLAPGGPVSPDLVGWPSRVRVSVVDRSVSARFGAPVAVVVSRADGGTGGRLSVAVDYSGFAHGFGANWSWRLRLVALPACVLTFPEEAGCAARLPLVSSNDSLSGQVSAVLDLAADPVGVDEPVVAGPVPVAGLAARGLAAAAVVEPDEPDGLGGSGLVLALTAGASSDAGDFAKTDMKASSEWAAGGQSGDFTWSYPIGVPPVPGGLAPKVTLGYSSGAVDGQTSGGNTQPGSFGEGWSYTPGYVERTYRACADDTQPTAPYWWQLNDDADLCWRLPNAQVNLGGKVSEIVLGSDGVWRLADDDGEKVQLLTGADNSDNNGEYWKITTTDGTQYWFGRFVMPDGKGTTGSTAAVPVFANHSGEPCFSTASLNSSRCQQAWRWMLDYVVDRHGNEMIFRYTRETNYTGLAGASWPTAWYHRSIYLNAIEYGTRLGQPGPAPARVVFANGDRCFSSDCSTHEEDEWPDTPWDLLCNSGSSCDNNLSPSFWTVRRVAAITTQVRVGGVLTTVDQWTPAQSFPDPGDGMAAVLWLDSITRTGYSGGGPLALPSLSFMGTATQNRADYAAGMASHKKFRITQVNTESGGRVQVSYSGADTNCVYGGSFPSPSNNTRRCFPQYYTSPSGSSGWAWWHKRVVTQVVVSDLVGGSPAVTHTYTYSTASSSTNVLWSHQNGAAVWSTSLAYRSWSHWRGYSDVTVATGTTSGIRSRTDSHYFRGLDDDFMGEGNPTRSVSFTPPNSGTWTDLPERAGHPFSVMVYDQYGGSPQQLTRNQPYTTSTGTRTLSTDWAIPNVHRSHLKRTHAQVRYEWIDGAWSARTTIVNTWHATNGRLVSVRDDGSVPDLTDTTCTRYSYADHTASHKLAFVSQVQTAEGDCTTTPTIPDDLLADVRYFYDNQATHGAAPTLGNITRTEAYGEGGWVVQSKDVVYDSRGRVTSATDVLDRTSSTGYTDTADGLTEQLTVTNPAGHQVTSTLEVGRGIPLTVTDANAKTTTGVYDPLGRLLSVTRPDNTTATPDAAYTYTLSKTAPSWVRAQVLGPNGNQIDSYEIYDGWLRPRQTQATAPDGNRVITDTAYDERGLAVKASVFYNAAPPASTLVTFNDVDVDRQTRTSYDGRNRPTVVALWSAGVLQHQATTSYAWDRTTTIPPAGGTTTMSVFDDLGRMTQLRQYESTDLNGPYTATAYSYNLRGDLVSVTDPASNQWTYSYDLLGRRTQTVDPDAGTSTTSYDDAGQITTTTDANATTVGYTYDELGRRTSIRDGSLTGPVRAAWAYDSLANGELDTATRHDGGLEYTIAVTGYDDGYRPLGSTVTIPASTANADLAGTYTTTFTYTDNGALESLSLPAIGGLPAETIDYTYTDQGLPDTTTGLDPYLAEAAYRWDGALAQSLHGAAGAQLRQTYTYHEPTARLNTHTAATETSPGVFTDKYSNAYTYDPAGNITAIAGTTNGSPDQTECFTYDHLQRLVEAWTETTGCSTPQRGGADPYHRQWTFDDIGNRLTQTDHNPVAGDTTWVYNVGAGAGVTPHQVGTITATGPAAGTPTRTFTYNDAGQELTRTTETGANQSLTFDPEGHLATLIGNGQTTSYLYDPDGNRLIARNSTTTTVYLGHTELAMPTGGGTITATRYYDCAIRTPAGLTWAITDHHNTNTAQIDAATLQTQRTRRLPYGEPRGIEPSTWFGSKGYVDGTADPTSLTHLGAREYDPTTGRFTSIDPLMDLTNPQHWHGYTYADNNPVTLSDPTGLAPNDPDYWYGVFAYYYGIGEHPGGPTGGYQQPLTLEEAAQSLYGQSAAEVIAGAPTLKAGIYRLQNAQLMQTCVNTGHPVACDAFYYRYFVLPEPDTYTFGDFLNDAGYVVGELLAYPDSAACSGGDLSGCAWLAVGYTPFKPLRYADELVDLVRAACSFAGNTEVLMADGTTTPIGQLDTGDVVLAIDPETGETANREVTAVWAHEDVLFDLRLASGGRVATTEDHPFWNTTDQQWQQAKELDPGDRLITPTGTAVVGTFDWFSIRTDEAYNLTVATTQTYFVLAGDTPILVHNTSGASACPRTFMVNGNGTTIEILPAGVTGIRNGIHMKTDDAIDTALDFLGPSYRDMGGGRFLSQDGLRQVRMTDRDLAHPTQVPHLNFEVYQAPIGLGLRGQPIVNMHIYLPEEHGWHLP